MKVLLPDPVTPITAMITSSLLLRCQLRIPARPEYRKLTKERMHLSNFVQSVNMRSNHEFRQTLGQTLFLCLPRFWPAQGVGPGPIDLGLAIVHLHQPVKRSSFYSAAMVGSIGGAK